MQKKKRNCNMVDYLVSRTHYGWFRFYVWFKKNLRTICLIGLFILPIYVMLFGDGAASDGTQIYFGPMSCVFLLIELLLMIGLAVASKVSTPEGIPVPEKRFTRHDNDQTYINDDRILELVLYMEELEDWFYDNYYSDER